MLQSRAVSVFRPNAVLQRTRLLSGEAGVRGALYRSEIRLENAPRQVAPGQFFMVRASGGGSDPLLPRALSALDYDPRRGVLHVCYRLYGAGTAALAARKPGERLEVHGPYGNGFDLSEPQKKQTIVLVGGGVGVPPLYLLAKELSKKHEVLLFQGAKAAAELLLVPDFRRLGVKVHVATDDGSKGFSGRVGELLGEHLSKLAALRPAPIIYVCGPHPMMKDVAARSKAAGLVCRVSLEEKMACATGICLGCVVLTEKAGAKKYVPSCTQGPVFDACEVVW
ncbi:MAG: dihydroorotate dehydrogenase electron transfer subunit [Bdellovibrionota bacterium]